MWRAYLYFLMLFKVTLSNPTPKTGVLQPFLDNPAVKLLQEYIQIDTSREENIGRAVNFWKRQAAELGLPFMVYRPSSKPICVITWTGANPKLPSIILNSHIDVVPADEQEWTYPPFSGYIDENGNMYGRGTQDTKAVALHYLEAIRKLKEDNVTLQRTLHITLMPDEETGGFNGIIPFMETEEFRALKPGFILDEGLSSPDGTLYATYQDKRPWQINLTIHGEGGHGSTFSDGTAMQKVQKLMDITTGFREQQKKIMVSKDVNDFGSYTTFNINIIKGGVAPNIIPSKVTVVIDMRLAVTAEVHEAEALIQSWIAQVGNETELSFIRKLDVSKATILDDSNPYWVAVVDAVGEMDMKIVPIVSPATSDMLFLRNREYPAIGFAYRPYTVSLMHAADEYLNMVTFLKGIDMYTRILKKIGNIL
ncbi:unnamed protein product [Parnassius apollo]|uniref:N-acyl-aliphatic-L-amino acid amidohydrolase n=1 Tax=Parnassius apollo TaxID=110799 RepID=A0A8S3WUT2_PARAO|nr:unnamed protein product [Parnassius apollo]